MFPPPEPDSDDGQHAAEAARALLPLLEEMRPHVAVSDILTLAPALAAERAGVPLATLIPHIYPVVEPGPAVLRDRPAAAADAARPRRSGGPGSGRSTSASSTAAATSTCSASGSACRRSSASTAASAPTWRWSRPTPSSSTRARWPAGVEVTGPMTFELPHPEIELPPGERAAGPGRPQHRPRLRQPPGPHRAGGARRRAGAGRGDDQPRRPAAPDRGPRQRRPRRLAQLQPADAGRLAGRSPTAATAPSPAPSAPAPRS